MRFVSGGDLDQLLRTTGALPLGRAVGLLEQLAGALDDAHAKGLVHRDVKPSNILLDGTIRHFCYLADFGITKMAGTERSTSLTRTGALLGSLAYMAPEQFDGAATARSDVYALTCVFFQLITGHKPYAGERLPALMHSHLKVPPPRPSVWTPAAGLFDDVVATGMAKDAEARFASAGELAAAARAAFELHRSRRTTTPAGRTHASNADIVTIPCPPAEGPDAATVPRAPAESPGGVTIPRQPAENHDAPTRPPEPVLDEWATVLWPARVAGPGGSVADRYTEYRDAEAVPAGRTDRHLLAPAPRRHPRLLPLAAAAAVIAVITLALLGTLSLSSGTGTPASAAASPPAPASTAPAPAAPLGPTSAAPAPNGPVLTEAVFTGRSSDNGLTVAVGMKDGRAVGYLCDGESVEAWLEGTVSGDRLTLQGRTPASKVTATVDQRSLLGTVTAEGVARPFSAQIATGAAGLYESRRTIEGISTRIGWIILPDGSQVGIRKEGDARTPAPPLDPATLETVDAGQVLKAARLAGTAAVILK
jgi:serine/threonine-protein kinase